jgi:hypothetical protein
MGHSLKIPLQSLNEPPVPVRKFFHHLIQQGCGFFLGDTQNPINNPSNPVLASRDEQPRYDAGTIGLPDLDSSGGDNVRCTGM